MKPIKFLSLIIIFTFIVACKDTPQQREAERSVEPSTGKDSVQAKSTALKEEAVSYKLDNITLNSFVVYNDTIKTSRPVVLVIHEWWGLNDYAKTRARQLAEMGYLAMAVDLYGDNKVAEDPEQAGGFAKPLYNDPKIAKKRFDAALAKIKTYSIADTKQIAVIGYCFGGAMALNFARLGEPDIKGVVSFHGNLQGVPITQNITKPKILICNGAADVYVPDQEIEQFKKQMDSIKANYTFKSYPDATHAFTNPASTEVGKKFDIHIEYNAKADVDSWNDMKAFFKEIFKNSR